MKTFDTLDLKIVVTGDPIDGLFFYGPFANGDDAIAFAELEHADQTWWITGLRHPIEVERENAAMNHAPIPPLPRSNEELLEVLDNVSAVADSIFGAHRMSMTPADRTARSETIRIARDICDEQLRGPDKDDPENDQDEEV